MFYRNLDIWQIVARVIALLISMPVSQSVRAWVSYKLGDPTAKYQGRISLNPVRHFDLMGALSMLLFGIGWSKPLPTDPRYYKNRKAGIAIYCFSGTLANLVMAYLSMILYKVFVYAHAANSIQIWYVMATIFSYMVMLNIVLAIFSIVPIPPFGGSRLLEIFLPPKTYYNIMRYSQYIMIVVMVLLFTGILSGPINFLVNGVLSAIDFLTGYVDSIAASIMASSSATPI